MSKDISDMIAAAESLSSLSSTNSGQIYSESTSKAKVSHDISTDNGSYVKGFRSMGKDDLYNSDTTPAFFIRTLVKTYIEPGDLLMQHICFAAAVY